MRICYFADGRSIHFPRWIKFFADAGYDLQFVSYQPVTDAQIKEIEAAGAQFLGTVGPFYLKQFWKTLRDLRWLKKTLASQRVDVVHSHFLGVNAWYAALSGFHPAVITVMGGDILEEDWRPGSDLREQWLTPYALRKADLVTCWSSKLTQIVKKYSRPGVRVEVIHGGVDLNQFSPGLRPPSLLEFWQLPADAKIVLSPRIMRPLYNIDSIARAAQRLCAADPRVYFLIFSMSTDDNYEAEVRAILGDDPLIRDRVRFVGSVPHHEMADYYRLADVTVSLPSSDGTPLTVLESLACGTPVVISNIPNYDEDYIEANRTALLTAPRDIDSIVTAIQRLLNDSGLGDRLATEGRRRVVERGSYVAQMTQMEQLYQTLR